MPSSLRYDLYHNRDLTPRFTDYHVLRDLDSFSKLMNRKLEQDQLSFKAKDSLKPLIYDVFNKEKIFFYDLTNRKFSKVRYIQEIQKQIKRKHIQTYKESQIDDISKGIYRKLEKHLAETSLALPILDTNNQFVSRAKKNKVLNLVTYRFCEEIINFSRSPRAEKILESQMMPLIKKKMSNVREAQSLMSYIILNMSKIQNAAKLGQSRLKENKIRPTEII